MKTGLPFIPVAFSQMGQAKRSCTTPAGTAVGQGPVWSGNPLFHSSQFMLGFKQQKLSLASAPTVLFMSPPPPSCPGHLSAPFPLLPTTVLVRACDIFLFCFCINSFTEVKFTHLNCIIQWFLVYAHISTTTPTIIYRTFSSL